MSTPPAPAAPLVVVWRITEACDLGCWFCEYGRERGGPRRSAQASEVLAFGASLGEYAAATGRDILVSWLGGEPLLWPPLREVGRVLTDEFGLRLGLTTNGTRLEAPGMFRHLAEQYSEVTVSVDGPAAFHDQGRGAPGLYQRLRRSVAALGEAKAMQGTGPLLRANVVLMRSNLVDFESVCQDLAACGIDEITFNALGGQPPGPIYVDERLRPEDLAWLRAALPGIRQRAAASAHSVAIRGSRRYLDRLDRQAGGHPWPVGDCQPGQAFLFIDELGRAAPCAFTGAGYGVPIVELRGGDDLQRLAARFTQGRQHERLAACDDCLSTQVFGKFATDANEP